MTGSSADFSTSASKDLVGKLGAFDELQSKILESITDGFVAFDKKWCYTYVNSNAARILRKSKEELLGKVCWDIFPEASKLRFFAEFNKAAKTGVPVHFEAFYPEPMNVWYECHCYPSEDGLTVFFSDVSNRKVAEEEIKAHRELFETVINSLLAAVIIIRGSDLKIILVNPAYNLIAPGKAMVGKAIQEVWPEIQPRFENLCRQVLNTGEPYHTLDEPFRIRRFSDDPLELAYFSWSLFRVRLPSNEGWGILNTFWETTKRKKTEEDLRASEERLKRSQAIAHLGSWELDLISNRLSWSDEVYRIFGLKPQEFGATYEAFLDAVHPDDRSAVDAAYTGSLREGKGTYEIEHRIVRKSNGEIRVVHEKCEHVRDESGKIIKSIGMVHDITERKKAEEKIERLASFPDLNPNPVVEADFDGNIEYVNPATKKIFPDLETLGLRHPFLSEWESVVNTFRVKKLPTFGREIKIGEHWYHQQFSLVPKNRCIRIYAENFDELKQAEEKLSKSEQRWATTLASIGDAVIATDVEGKITFINAVAEKLTGWSLNEASNQPVQKVFNIINEYSRQRVEDPVAKVLEKGLIVGLANHTILVCKGGKELPIDDSGAPIKDKEGKSIGVVLVFRDITERKKAEDAVRERERRYRGLYEAVAGGIVVQDMSGIITEANDMACEILGLTRSQILGRTSIDPRWHAIHEDGSPFPGENHPSMIALHSGKAVRNVVMGVFHPNEDTYRWILVNAEPIVDNLTGHVQAAVATFVDITTMKKAEEATAYQDSLLSRVHEVIFGVDANYTITYWNKVAEAVFGWTKEEAIGKNSGELLQTKIEGSSRSEGIAKLFATGHYEGEVQYRRKDGSYVLVEVSTATLTSPNGELQGVVTAARDISERKKLQQQLEEYSKHLEDLVEEQIKQLKGAERLAAIGATAGMVGHDIRNPLQAIVGELYLAKDEVASMPGSNAKRNLQESITCIEENLFYIDKIIADLQDYTKPLKPNKEKVNIEKVIEEALLIVSIPNNLQVNISIEKDFPAVTADFSMLKRVLINLIQNAVQAMPNGGSLNINAKCKNNHAYINIEDTGEGIPEEVKIKLFTPLFTTKSKGQGFGLAVVKRLVEAQGGKISFESEQGKGTTFTVQFPLT